MSFLAMVFVVLLLFWLFFGLWSGWPAAGSPVGPAGFAPLGNTLIPWLCVAILGYVVFGGGALPPPR
jgi:hypothetical protein